MRTCRSCRIFCFCKDSCARSHLPTSRWRNLIEEAGQPCLCPGEEDLKCGCFLTSVLLAFPYGLSCSARLTTASENRNLVKIKDFALEHARAKHPRTLGPLANCIGWIWMAFPPFDHFADLKNRGLMLMVVGLPNATGLTDDADANKQRQIQMQIQTTNNRGKNTCFFPKILRQIQQLRLASPPSLVAWRRLASVQQDTGVTVSRSHWNTNCRVEKEKKKQVQWDFQKFLLLCFWLNIWPKLSSASLSCSLCISWVSPLLGKLMQGVKWTAPKFNCVPGLTRDVTFFQLLDCTNAQMIWPELLLSTSLTKALKSPQIVLCPSQET